MNEINANVGYQRNINMQMSSVEANCDRRRLTPGVTIQHHRPHQKHSSGRTNMNKCQPLSVMVQKAKRIIYMHQIPCPTKIHRVHDYRPKRSYNMQKPKQKPTKTNVTTTPGKLTNGEQEHAEVEVELLPTNVSPSQLRSVAWR